MSCYGDKKAQKYTVTAGIIRRRSLADHFSFFTRSLKARLMTLVSVQAARVMITTGCLVVRNQGEHQRPRLHRPVRWSFCSENGWSFGDRSRRPAA